MNVNFILGALLAIAVAGLVSSLNIDWRKVFRKPKREDTSEGLCKELVKSGADKAFPVDDKTIQISIEDRAYWLSWRRLPLVALGISNELKEEVDTDKAADVARRVSQGYDCVAVRVGDDRELHVVCSTLTSDPRAIPKIARFMVYLINSCLQEWVKEYDEETKR